jgi:hypothetical protein
LRGRNTCKGQQANAGRTQENGKKPKRDHANLRQMLGHTEGRSKEKVAGGPAGMQTCPRNQ